MAAELVTCLVCMGEKTGRKRGPGKVEEEGKTCLVEVVVASRLADGVEAETVVVAGVANAAIAAGGSGVADVVVVAGAGAIVANGVAADAAVVVEERASGR